MIEINNEDCLETMKKIRGGTVDVILTSPFYNTNKKAGNNRTLLNTKLKGKTNELARYDVHIDNMSNDEYSDYTVKLFRQFDKILKADGTVLYNLSYGTNNTTGMIETVNAIISDTPFTLADVIIWKKRNSIPNTTNKNRLTRIVEFIYVFCRKDEQATFYSNKRVVSVRDDGQKCYENITNYIEAPNNDGSCPWNKATYSSELCEKLLKIYAPVGGTVYDPFIGSGTTAVACQKLGLSCIGSEISPRQVEWANRRLDSNNQISLNIF